MGSYSLLVLVAYRAPLCAVMPAVSPAGRCQVPCLIAATEVIAMLDDQPLPFQLSTFGTPCALHGVALIDSHQVTWTAATHVVNDASLLVLKFIQGQGCSLALSMGAYVVWKARLMTAHKARNKDYTRVCQWKQTDTPSLHR